MPLSRSLSFLSATFAFLSLSLTSYAQQAAPPAAGPAAERLQATYAQLPLSFEPNRGQTDARVQFLARTPGASVFLTGADAVIQTASLSKDQHGKAQAQGSFAVRMHLAGATDKPVAATEQPLPGTVNYLRGNVSKQWQKDVPTFGGVRLASVYPGVDLRYYGHAGRLEYDFVVAPQADAAAVRLQFQGATARVEKNGDLLLPGARGTDLRFDKPVAYQTIDGKRIPVEASFQLAANHDVTFQLGQYDHSRELTIDPTLVYLGTLGTGTNQVDVSQITVDSTGAMYLIGTTNDSTFPATTGAYQTVCGPANATAGGAGIVYCNGTNNTSAFISKLSPDGTSLVYSTYLSGHGGLERGTSIAVDAAGVAYLLGTTGSDDFPVTSDAFQKNCVAYYGVFGGPNDVQCDGNYNGGGTEYTIGNQPAFFSKLSADGSSLLYSSFLGGTAPVYPNTIALDASGNIYLSGQVRAYDAPDIASCVSYYEQHCQGQVQFPGITSSGYITLSTAKDSNGNATSSNASAFLSKFSNDGRTLLYGTFFGDNTSAIDVLPTSMAVGANGIAFLGGYTQAVNYPVTANAIKSACTQPGSNPVYCNTFDGYLAAIDTTKAGTASLIYSTRLGGSTPTQGSNIPMQEVLGLTADSSNNLFVTGYTFDHTFQMAKGGYQATCPNYDPNDPTDRCDSAFVLKLNPSGTALLNGSFLGGPTARSAESIGYNVRLDSKGQVYLYGRSNDGGGDFPQVNALQGYKGGNQLFISTFSTDLSKLIFSTRFGNPSYTDHSVKPAGGMALDGSDNVYFAGTTNDTQFAGTAGTYNTATATGEGDHPFFAKLSKVLQPAATTLTLPTTPVITGNTLTLTASVDGTLQTTPTATGTVTFTYTNTAPATVAGTATLDGNGTATLKATAPAAGTYTVVASYGGDNTYDVSSSAAGSLTVNNIVTPTIALTAAPTSGKIDTSFTFTASLTSTSGTPTGTVYFLDGTSTLGSAVLAGGSAAYSTTLPVGTHAISVRYGGDSNFAVVSSAAQSVSVTTYAPSTTLTSSAPSAVFGTAVTLTANVVATGTTLAPSGTVTFRDGDNILGMGTIKNGTATYVTSTLSVGPHSLTASYGGDGNFSMSTSPAVTQTIVAASVTLTASTTSLTVTRGSSGTITITATPTGTLTSTVTFACGTTPQHTTCNFNPTTLTFTSSTAAQSTTFSFNTNTAALEIPGRPFSHRNGLPEALAAGLFLPLGLLGLVRGRRRLVAARRLGLLLLILAASIGIAGISGCGGSTPTSSTGTTGTAAGTYNVPVTASVNGGTSTLTLNITVQ